jgi:hypothetical protein
MQACITRLRFGITRLYVARRLTPALLKDLARFLKTNAGQWFCQHVLSQDPSLVLQQAAASAKQPVLKVAVVRLPWRFIGLPLSHLLTLQTSLKPQTLFNYKGKPVYSEAPRSLDFCDEIRLPFVREATESCRF